MASEETPLLAGADEIPSLSQLPKDVYQRFSPSTKRAVVGMISTCGLIPFFVNGTFTPAISQISQDLNTSGSVVNYAVSTSWVAASLGGLIAGAYSTFYGRRVIYTYSLPVMVLGSLGVSIAPNVQTLLFSRFFQSLGSSPSQVLGAGVIGDLYKVEERGRAMAVFFATGLVGPSLAPLIGGWVTYYFSWRTMQSLLGMFGAGAFCVMYLFFPETSHPGSRGIDKKRAEHDADSPNQRVGFVFLNPFRLMLLLRSPNLFLISVILSASLMAMLAIIVPLVYTIGERYNLANEAIIGLCFLPCGLGSIVGTFIVGYISDYTVINWRKKRGGVWYPEDRLRAALVPLGLIVPLTLIIYGLLNHFVNGRLGLGLCLLSLFLNGVGVEMAFGPCAAYLVDVLQSRSAEALAANSGLRAILVATGIAFVLPMINRFGIAVTNIVFAVNVWAAFGFLCAIIRYGDRMRAWVDVGFSVAPDS